MVGLILLYLVSFACAALGVAMLRNPDWWVEFFRQGRTETGRRINRWLITRSTLLFQATVVLLGAAIFLAIAVWTTINRFGVAG